MALWSWRSSAPVLPAPIPILIPQAPAHSFTAWTESLVISGRVRGQDRLSDILNARQPLRIEEPSVIPVGAPRTAQRAPTDLVMDPFDFDLVLGTALDPRSAAERASRRIHKVRYPVVIRGSNFEVQGIVHLFAGNAPEFAAHQAGSLFLPITEASVRRERRLVSDPRTDVVLVNRYAIRRIEQVDIVH